WLEDWVANNPPYTGWHWTSALESGMRLIAFTWIDAFLTAFEGRDPGDLAKRLTKLRADILPAHVWFVSEQPPARRVVRPGAGQRALARLGQARHAT
ncbi:MAG: hypothetical protein HOF22_11750, partial [Verrucomicrobia bacterium]|nr:hypothetical protein [Verrucomicrobiota bacterium]